MWTLILTVTVNTTTMLSVPGFTSEHACQVAAWAWAASEHLEQKDVRTSWVCVRN
jgi:hypothetical protein